MPLDSLLNPSSDLLWRMAAAVLLLAGLFAAEARWPWRSAQPRRWLPNLALGALSMLTVLALPLASMTAAARWAEAQHFGLLNLIALPPWLAVTLALLALDLALYAQHRALHLPGLWRLHRVHHLDPMLDVTSGVRFHPLEALVSALYKSLVVALLGAPLLAVSLSALLTTVASLITHGNFRLPLRVDAGLRWLFITPSLHRIHHSVRRAETASNFGSVLWVWDRLFGSARAAAQDGESLVLGVQDHPPETQLSKLLREPFQRRTVQ